METQAQVAGMSPLQFQEALGLDGKNVDTIDADIILEAIRDYTMSAVFFILPASMSR